MTNFSEAVPNFRCEVFWGGFVAQACLGAVTGRFRQTLDPNRSGNWLRAAAGFSDVWSRFSSAVFCLCLRCAAALKLRRGFRSVALVLSGLDLEEPS